MARVKKEKPVIIFRKNGRRLVPETAFDEEELDRLPNGATVSVTPMSIKGHEQLATYWFVLSKVVKATGRWPRKEDLHDAIKWELRYVSIAYNMIGVPRLVTDSIGLDAMDDADRKDFIDQAFALVMRETGIDPSDVIREAKLRHPTITPAELAKAEAA